MTQPGDPIEFLPLPSSSLVDAQRTRVLLDTVRELSWRGRYLDAQALLPQLQALPDVSAAIHAARIVGHLGARRDSEARVMRLWRAHRDDAQVLVEMARALAYRRGPFRAWRLMQARPLPATAGADVVADWHSLRAYVLGSLRDFDGAERAHREALELDRGEAWLHVEWAYVCEQRDAYAEAVEAAEHALALRPGYRAALQALAHLYTLVGRDADALALFAKSVAESQSGGLAIQLLELQVEHGEHAAAARTLADVERFSPLADKALRQWMHARRADLALALGRAAEARDEAQRAGGEFYDRLAARLAEPAATARRVVLPVGFVRQHAVTCAPATLATLSRYWGHEAAHLDIAEKICYDGTPNHSERHWSEDQGFVTREFTVDWDTACKLLDAGVPFTLTTVYTASAHLQAVIGYDALRGTLLIRDPFKRTHNEFDAAALFDRTAPPGRAACC